MSPVFSVIGISLRCGRIEMRDGTAATLTQCLRSFHRRNAEECQVSVFAISVNNEILCRG